MSKAINDAFQAVGEAARELDDGTPTSTLIREALKRLGKDMIR